MKKIAQLTKQSGKKGANIGRNPLRGDTIDGFYEDLPQEGQPFVFFSRSLTPGGIIRVITTSLVTGAFGSDPDCYTFSTLNSSYTLKPIETPKWLADYIAELEKLPAQVLYPMPNQVKA